MVPQTRKGASLTRGLQPLLLLPRVEASKPEVANRQGQMRVVKLTRKRIAAEGLCLLKGQPVNIVKGKGHKTENKSCEEVKPVCQRKSQAEGNTGLMSSSVLLQERTNPQTYKGTDENSVSKKVFLPMVDKQEVSAQVIQTNRVLLPINDGVIIDASFTRKTPVLLKPFSGPDSSAVERNTPVILTSKDFYDYNDMDQPVNLSMKPHLTSKEPKQNVILKKQMAVDGSVDVSAAVTESAESFKHKTNDDMPTNLSKKPKITPRLSFSSAISIESVLTPSESKLSHSVSITPIQKLKRKRNKLPIKEETRADSINEETFVLVDVKQEPEELDPLEEKAETDIDDDEETYLQRMEADIASMVQVKLECGNDDLEDTDQTSKNH